jgi:hypothetical protein
VEREKKRGKQRIIDETPLEALLFSLQRTRGDAAYFA